MILSVLLATLYSIVQHIFSLYVKKSEELKRLHDFVRVSYTLFHCARHFGKTGTSSV